MMGLSIGCYALALCLANFQDTGPFGSGQWMRLDELTRSQTVLDELGASQDQRASVGALHLEIDEHLVALKNGVRKVEPQKLKAIQAELEQWIGGRDGSNAGKATKVIQEIFNKEQVVRLIQVQNQCYGLTSILLEHNLKDLQIAPEDATKISEMASKYRAVIAEALRESEDPKNPSGLSSRELQMRNLKKWADATKATEESLGLLIGPQKVDLLYGARIDCSAVRRDVAEALGIASKSLPFRNLLPRPFENQYLLLHIVLCPDLMKAISITPMQSESLLSVVKRETRSYVEWEAANRNTETVPPWSHAKEPMGARLNRINDEVLRTLDETQRTQLLRVYFQLCGPSATFSAIGVREFHITKAQVNSWVEMVRTETARQAASQRRVDLEETVRRVLTPSQFGARQRFLGEPISSEFRRSIEQWLTEPRDSVGVNVRYSVIDKVREELKSSKQVSRE